MLKRDKNKNVKTFFTYMVMILNMWSSKAVYRFWLVDILCNLHTVMPSCLKLLSTEEISLVVLLIIHSSFSDI